MQKAEITDQVFLYVVNGFESSAMYEQAGILEEALGVQMGFGSMYKVPTEEFVEVIMEAQKNIQQYYENGNVFWKNYYQGKDMGSIDSERLEVIANSAVSLWNEAKSFGGSSWVIQEVPSNMIRAIFPSDSGAFKEETNPSMSGKVYVLESIGGGGLYMIQKERK